MGILQYELERVKGLEREEWEKWLDVKEDFWGDIKPRVQQMLKRLLESSMEIEVIDLIGSERWQHNYSRPTYRNGSYRRNFTTSFGYIQDIKVPRVRDGGIKFRVLPRYKRRSTDINETILEMFLAGVSTRRVEEVLTPLLDEKSISPTTVSKITKQLDRYVTRFHNRQFDDEYVYMICDGIYLNTKSPVHKKRRVVLVAYGIKEDGIRELIDFYLAPKGESENAWTRFLSSLYYRGIEGKKLRMVVIDGNAGLRNALDFVYPNAKIQRCWAHKLRNVSNKLPKRLKDACVAEARDIYNQENYDDAVYTFKKWAQSWNIIEPKVVKCIEDDLEELLNFYREPFQLHKKLRTTNIIERVFREVRRRTIPMSCFNNRDSVERIIFAIFHRQNKIWEDKPILKNFEKLTQKS